MEMEMMDCDNLILIVALLGVAVGFMIGRAK